LLSKIQQNEKNENKNKEIGGQDSNKITQNPVKIKFISNYINVKDDIILDRSFYQTNKFNSLLRNQEQIGKTTAVAKWDYTNPNILSLVTSDSKVRYVFLFFTNVIIIILSFLFFHSYFSFSWLFLV
jgi:hypothetical protein